MQDYNNLLFFTETSPVTVRQDLAFARKTIEDRYERLEVLRTQAESIGSIRYDKDRVQSSPDYSDVTLNNIIRIMDAEEAFKQAKDDFDYLFYCFNVYLDTANLDRDAKRIWICRYANGWSIGRTARALGTTRSHVQYQLNKHEDAFLAVPA